MALVVRELQRNISGIECRKGRSISSSENTPVTVGGGKIPTNSNWFENNRIHYSSGACLEMQTGKEITFTRDLGWAASLKTMGR